jgi:hypothetical protein
MLVYKCDICKEEGALDTLRRVVQRLGFPPRPESSRVWEICERCEPRLFELLGEERGWSPDNPIPARGRT